MAGWRRWQGTVEDVGPVYTTRSTRSGKGRMLRFGLSAIASYFLWQIYGPMLAGSSSQVLFLAVGLLALVTLSWIRSKLFLLLLSVFFWRKAAARNEGAEVPVLDVRLRVADSGHGGDPARSVRQLRFYGHFSSGNISPGDVVQVRGFERKGTLVCSRGINQTTGCELRLRA